MERHKVNSNKYIIHNNNNIHNNINKLLIHNNNPNNNNKLKILSNNNKQPLSINNNK